MRKSCDSLQVLANQVFLESLVNTIPSGLVTQASYISSLGHACPSSVVLQLLISLGTLAVDDQASLMAPRDWFHLDRLRLCSLCLKEGCYVAQCRFSASATLTLILSAPHSIASQARPLRDSFIACVKLFPNSRNSSIDYSTTTVSHTRDQTTEKTPICVLLLGFSFSLYPRSDYSWVSFVPSRLSLPPSSLRDSSHGFQVLGSHRWP